MSVDEVLMVESSTTVAPPVTHPQKPWDERGKRIPSSSLLPHQPVKLHFHAWLPLELMLLPAGVFIFLRSKQCFCHGVSQYPPRVISWKKRPCYWGALEGEPDVHFSKTLKSNFCFWLCCGHGKQPWSGKLAVFVWWCKVISLLNLLPISLF